MNDIEKISIAAFSLIFAIGFIFILFIMLTRYNKKSNYKVPSNFNPPSAASQPDKEFQGDFFFIHNHLLKNINVYIVNPKGEKIKLANIQKSFKQGLSEKATTQSFAKGNMIEVYTLERNITPYYDDIENLFGVFTLDIPTQTTIKEFHIGMITSKVLGSHYTEDVIPTGALQGRSRVYIHNLTPRILRLNYNIIIPPFDTLIYYGEHVQGVPLGLVLKDQDQFFEDFIYKMPATDIIYGINSDTDFPKFAGFSLDEEDLLDIPNEPMWLLEEGFMGGPANRSIDPTFLPKEGPEILPVDRWGRRILKKNIGKK